MPRVEFGRSRKRVPIAALFVGSEWISEFGIEIESRELFPSKAEPIKTRSRFSFCREQDPAERKRSSSRGM